MLFRPKRLIQSPRCATVSGESGSESGQICGRKIRSHLMWSSIRGADNFICRIVVRSCRRFISDSAHLRLSYCNSFGNVCQEVSRVNIWDAIVKEKGRGENTMTFNPLLKYRRVSPFLQKASLSPSLKLILLK